MEEDLTKINSKSSGLRGQVAGETSLSTVGISGAGLTYRGFDVKDLAEYAEFEEVAYLLVYGNLPNKTELENYKKLLSNLRDIPDQLKNILETLPSSSHPMDVIRTGCSALGCLETEKDFSEQENHINRMLAIFPSIIAYW